MHGTFWLCLFPACRARADSHGIAVPEFVGQKSVVEARRWHKIAKNCALAAAAVALVLGVWFWFEWFGSRPRPIFAVRFDTIAYSGKTQICGQDQIVLLHGSTLARYDLKTQKEIWTHELIDPTFVEAEVTRENKAVQAEIDKANGAGSMFVPRMPSREVMEKGLRQRLTSALQLFVSDQNVWLATEDKLIHYDWDSGKSVQEIR